MKKVLNKKIIFIILSFIISAFAVASIMIGISSQEDNLYSIYIDKYDNEDKLMINGIYIGDTYYELQDFENKYLKYNSKKEVLQCNENCENQLMIFEINVSSIDNLKLSILNDDKYEYELKVNKNNVYYQSVNIEEKNGEYYFNDQVSTISTLINYIKDLSLGSIILYIVIMFIVLAISYFSINYIFNFASLLRDGNFSLKKFILSMILLFILNLFYIYLLMQFISWLAILPLIITLIILIIYMANGKKADISSYFALIIMFIGVTFIFVFPPLHVPDETSHFIKSYQTSFVFQENNEVKDSYGRQEYVYLPKKFRDFLIKYGSQTDNFDYRLQPRTYLHDLFDINNYKDLSNETTWYGTKYSSPIAYLPGAMISIIARITSMPMLLFYLLGKLFTFIIGSIMCYYAIKIVPYFKKIFFIVPLLPIFFQQSAGYCMDWLTNSTFILSLAFLLKKIYGKDKINKKDILIIVLLMTLLSFCKFGYFPIALLILLIPSKKFKDENKKLLIIKKTLIISIPILLSILVNIVVSRLGYVPGAPSSRDTIPISTIFSEPVNIFSMVIETFKTRLDLDFFRGLVDGFGWSTVWANDLILFLSMSMLMLIVLCKDENNKKLTKKQFIVILISFVIICAIVYGAMLFGWTIKGDTSIDGLQPRYFIPAIMLLYILLQSDFISIKVKNKNIFYSMIMILINILGLITIISGFYS